MSDEKRFEMIEKRLELLEEFLNKNFIKKTQQVVDWHDHGSSGKMHWNLPPEILTDEFQKEIVKIKEHLAKQGKKGKTLMKSAIDRPTDEIDIKLTPVTKNQNS